VKRPSHLHSTAKSDYLDFHSVLLQVPSLLGDAQ